MAPKIRKFKFLALASGEIPDEIVKKLVDDEGGKVDRKTKIDGRVLYEMSFSGKRARDTFASFWRLVSNGVVGKSMTLSEAVKATTEHKQEEAL